MREREEAEGDGSLRGEPSIIPQMDVIDCTSDDAGGENDVALIGRKESTNNNSLRPHCMTNGSRKRSRSGSIERDDMDGKKEEQHSQRSSRSPSVTSEPNSSASRKRRTGLRGPLEYRVLFAEVQAQEREMDRIKYLNSNNATAVALRKSEATASINGTNNGDGGRSSKSKKQTRAEERRSKRLAIRRGMSPRSPDGGPRMDVRVGPVLVDFDGTNGTTANGHSKKKPRFANNGDAIKDAVMHSTAWRHVQFDEAPLNILPDRNDVPVPFSIEYDRSLGEYDADLALKCAILPTFGRSKPLTLSTGSLADVSDYSIIEERIHDLIAEATPLIKNCHDLRVKAIIGNARKQIASYLSDLPKQREKAVAIRESYRELKISRLEKIATRKILQNVEFVSENKHESRYIVGRGETAQHAIIPENVVCLSKVAMINRSTTCIGTRESFRVEDDPIIRFVPYFSTENNGRIQAPQFEDFETTRKETLVGSDDEAKEYLLRYVVHGCDGEPVVFDVLKELGEFQQPLADYTDLHRRELLQRTQMKQLGNLNSEAQDQTSISAKSISALLQKYVVQRSGALLRDRLESPPSTFQVNYLHFTDGISSSRWGIRSAPSERYDEVAFKYQELFCRRCFTYNCLNHGIKQPLPTTRTDPRYPLVKASAKLFRSVADQSTIAMEVETAEEVETTSHESIEEQPEKEEKVNIKLEDSAENEEDTENGIRRSVRSLTAANTKASSLLQSQRPKMRKKVNYLRSKWGVNDDVSEYLGFDNVYRTMIAERKTTLFNSDKYCNENCFKARRISSTQTDHPEPSLLRSTSDVSKWKSTENALLKKLEKCLGRNPCVLATILLTRTCSEIADALDQHETWNGDAIHNGTQNLESLIRNDRDRSNGVHGNHHEHLRRTRFQRMKDRGANHEYIPCNHVGSSCNSGQCSCMRRDHYCEKSCGCSYDCSNRFPGCKCDPRECQTPSCPCFFAGRECNPDVCISCAASELPVIMADPIKKHKTSEQLRICGNVNILRGKAHKLGVAASDTHGWGAFALQKVKKGDFIYEYTGSLVSQDEAERRGNVYDKTTISFLFDLNEDAVVDATRKGNKSKFANHNSNEPNCVAKIMQVNGDHRIGIYAKEDIEVGDELFFNYGYNGVIPDWSQARIGSR